MKKVLSLMLVLLLAFSALALPATAAGKAKTKITLNKKGTVELKLGESLQLKAAVTPEAAVAWKSSKKSVATVDKNGLVKPLKEGKTKITAKAGGKTAKVTIKVVDPKKPIGLTIKQGKKYTLNIDKKLTLGITLKPAGAESGLKFKSSKTKVATVDANGVVTPKKEGKTKITVTSVKNKKAKASITITVRDPYKPTKVSITNGKSASLLPGETLKLATTLSPSTAKSPLIFKSSKPKVASVNASGKITALKKGTAKITVTAKNNKKAKATITVKVNKAAASKDLYTYFGKPIKAAATALKFEYEGELPDGDDTFFRISGDGALLEATSYGKKYEVALVDSCDIYGEKSPFNFAGVSNGMKWTDARAKLKSGGWKYIGKGDTYEAYQKGEIELRIDTCFSMEETGETDFTNFKVADIYAHIVK